MEVLFDNFDTLIESPGGIKKLRELILQLAVMGKLVPQDPEDEPAAVLLEKIKEEKERLIKQGKIKSDKPLPEKSDEEKPYELPGGWSWVQLNDICEIITKGSSPKWQGINYTNKNDGILFITSENVGNFILRLGKIKYVEKKFNDIEPRSILKKNDLLMNIVGGSIGRTALYNLDKTANINQAVCLIRIVRQEQYLSLQYLLYYFNTSFCVNMMFDKQVDNARANLSMGNISKFFIPIPPFNEQKRIVEQVERLMAMCDELEKKKEKRDQKRVSLNNASLEKLLASREADEFQDHWGRINENFDILYDSPGNVVKLKQAILQLAVMGKLVPQDPNDEPAAVLLEQIKGEKERLIKEGKIKSDNSLPELSDEEIPYDLPEGWRWVNFIEVCAVITDGEHLTPKYSDRGVPLLSAKNIGEYKLNFEDIKFVSIEVAKKCWLRCYPEKGDILVVSRGGGIGRTIISEDSEYCLMGSVLLFKPLSKISNKYLLYYLTSPLGNVLLRNTSNYTAQQAIYISHLKKNYLIPLPPLNEQKRIVARVERLMSFCDRLQENLQDAKAKSDNLFNAVVNHLQNFSRSPHRS